MKNIKWDIWERERERESVEEGCMSINISTLNQEEINEIWKRSQWRYSMFNIIIITMVYLSDFQRSTNSTSTQQHRHNITIANGEANPWHSMVVRVVSPIYSKWILYDLLFHFFLSRKNLFSKKYIIENKLNGSKSMMDTNEF